MNLTELRAKWDKNAGQYTTAEIGGGVHSFVNDILSHPELFGLKLTAKKTTSKLTYVHDTEADSHGRPDFVLYISGDITIPCEAKCYTRHEEGVRQLQGYRSEYTKEYGILTDGFTWRFYRSHSYQIRTLDQMLESPKLFRAFWENYLTPESYYSELFMPSGQGIFFEEPLNLNDSENRKIYFKETSRLIEKFCSKINIKDRKTALETAYAYLIQFILYKVLVDNRFKRFEDDYKRLKRQIVQAIQSRDLYNLIVLQIRNISEYISQNIYQPFAAEQQSVNEKLLSDLKQELTIQDIAPWLDIIAYIDKFDFSNLKNEIFGFIYENYLKDLYGEKNQGQFFTDPAVVNFMLDEMGYTPKELAKNKTGISIIDPACGAGTFLYSAVDRIIEAYGRKETQAESDEIKELVDKNVFGLDIAEFPLYLAEMCILLRLLPRTVTELYDSPVEKKLKLFKTKDSISEFLDANIGMGDKKTDWQKFFFETDLGYPSFMRDNKDLQEMIESMQGSRGKRFRFDYVVGNPPYIGYNESCKQKIPFTLKIKDKNCDSISMGNVYGINLNTVPDRRKPYSPKPNLYAFFVALALALLKKGGKMCYIIPQTMLTAGDMDVLRYHLAKNTTIEKLLAFESNLFVSRGLQQKRAIATSSLILVVKKEMPAQNHKVEIVNYKSQVTKHGEGIKEYFKKKNRAQTCYLLQSRLLESVENWNFIKSDPKKIRMNRVYRENSLSIEEYRKNVLAHYDEIHWDVGYILDKKHFTKSRVNTYPILDFKESTGYTGLVFKDFYPKDESKIQLTRNSRYTTLGRKYNIVNRIKNFQKFYLTTEPVIFKMGTASIIATDNKSEALFLFSILNSTVSHNILEANLKLANEKEFQVAIKSIKQYIRIPRITPKNQKLKDKIIARTEEMLALEDVMLKDIVDFSSLRVQKFDRVRVEKNELVLFNGKDFRLKIADGQAKLVKKIIDEKCKNCGLLVGQTISLTELKSLPAIDFEKQDAIKENIDDLVFALYFDVPDKDVVTHEFYNYVHSQRNT